MKTYEVTAKVTYRASVLVEAESLAEAENAAHADFSQGGGLPEQELALVEDLLAEEKTDTKAPNVCVACEG